GTVPSVHAGRPTSSWGSAPGSSRGPFKGSGPGASSARPSPVVVADDRARRAHARVVPRADRVEQTSIPDAQGAPRGGAAAGIGVDHARRRVAADRARGPVDGRAHAPPSAPEAL